MIRSPEVTTEATPDATPPLSRDELIVLVTKAHGASAYADSSLAGKTLAAQSKLPKLVAENLGAGFGQWDFFPEVADIVDFALAYVPPSNEEEMWTLVRAWATDDATGKHTTLRLIGQDLFVHELRRIEVPKLKALFDERRPGRALTLREELGLPVPEKRARAAKAEKAAAPPAASSGASADGAPAEPKPVRVPLPKGDGPIKMPKPKFVPPVKAAPPPPAKRYMHPKFGEGVLETQDGVGEEAKLTVKFAVGSKTLLAKYLTELT